MRAKKFDVQEVITNLQGTCDTLDGVIADTYPDMTENDLTADDLTIIDNEIFLCATCNWWCEINKEASDDDDTELICQDCKEVE